MDCALAMLRRWLPVATDTERTGAMRGVLHCFLPLP